MAGDCCSLFLASTSDDEGSHDWTYVCRPRKKEKEESRLPRWELGTLFYQWPRFLQLKSPRRYILLCLPVNGAMCHIFLYGMAP